MIPIVAAIVKVQRLYRIVEGTACPLDVAPFIVVVVQLGGH